MTILHLTRFELYRMHPGLFFDMVQIYNNSHQIKEKDPDGDFELSFADEEEE